MVCLLTHTSDKLSPGRGCLSLRSGECAETSPDLVLVKAQSLPD